MKICYIANSASSHTKKWVDYFAQKGHEMHIISHENVEIPGAHVHYIDYNIKNFPFKAAQVHKKIKEINPDVLHAHQANTCGLYAATMKGYEPIVSAWGSDILVAPERSKLMKWITKYVLKKAKYITSDAYYMSDKIVELGADRDKVYTFPMGVEKEIFNYRHEYDVNNKFINIISFRRLEKIYNIDILIKGFSEALKANDNMFLTVAASGSEEDNLKKLVKDLGIENKVKFTGRYNPKDIGKILQDKDVFISIPQSDSTSVSLLESLGVGVFPIVSNLPANREWVENKKNGIVIKSTTPEEVRDAILWCAENKSHMAEVSNKNINMIKERAVWEDNAKIVEELYVRCKRK
jgi:glycosyltransferase involved in cell wall biosynthesis